MRTNDWFPDGIVLRGTRTGTTEEILEPYSPESAERLAMTYAALWGEPIEWWGVATGSARATSQCQSSCTITPGHAANA